MTYLILRLSLQERLIFKFWYIIYDYVLFPGPSGLVAIKTLLTEGHFVQGFEKNAFTGGMWNYDEHTNTQGEEHGYVDCSGISHSVYSSLHLLTSSYCSTFSDYMPEEIFKNKNHFWTHQEYSSYIHNYTEHFQLSHYIRFSTTVLMLTKCSCPEKGWNVTYEDADGLKEECFEFVFVASGSCCSPYSPDVENIESYQGTLVHSSQVRRETSLFRDKKVLVIGGGFSGGDMATSAVKSGAEAVYWSLTRGHRSHWCFDRYVRGQYGLKPWDVRTSRKQYKQRMGEFWDLLKPVLVPLSSDKYHTKPMIPGDALSVADSHFLKQAYESKEIIRVSPIIGIVNSGKDVELRDGNILKRIDVIVAATGFNKRFPYLDDIWPVEEQEKCQLFQHVICPNKELDGIGFLTMVTGPVSLFIVMEMQARWLCKMLLPRKYDVKGHLYSKTHRQEMVDNIPEMCTLLDPHAYLDNLAGDLQCMPPDPDSLLESRNLQDIQLAIALLHGPLIGAQYRLVEMAGQGDVNESALEKVVRVAKLVLGEKYQELVDAIVSKYNQAENNAK